MISIGWKGNRKLSWPTFNLPAGKTCPSATPMCREKCYAMKAERMYPTVLPARERNLAESKKPGFVNAVCREIDKKKTKPTIFRIHESGDFYNSAYYFKWCAIARRNPEIRFFAFTKCFGLFSYDRPENLVLIASVFPDEARPVPDNAPVFETVNKGDTREFQQCHGHCDDCGICPFAADDMRVWAEMH